MKQPHTNPGALPIPTQAAAGLDPYPERPARHPGVRPHTQPSTPHDWKVTTDPTPHRPFLVAAWVETEQPTTRRRLTPWTSIGLYALGQLILAVTIATEALDPGLGVLVCLLWVACGLALIAAELIGRTDGDGR